MKPKRPYLKTVLPDDTQACITCKHCYGGAGNLYCWKKLRTRTPLIVNWNTICEHWEARNDKA